MLYIPDAFIHRTDAMRQIIRLLQSNPYYCRGQFDLRDAPLYAAKHEAYGAFVDEMTRYRWKKKGVACVQAIYLIDDARVFYWLFVSEGNGYVVLNEKLLSTTDKKTRVSFAGYEAVRVTQKEKQGFAWTWQIKPEKYDELENEIKQAIRQKDFEKIRQWTYNLKRAPSFSMVRKQAYKLAKNAENEWKRVAKGDYPGGIFAIGWQGRFKKAKTKPLYQSLGKSMNAYL